ncbi:MAG: 2-dehydropantoate 2-reductase, partial [Chloroflexaceae bacterium]|nr:2-dehydropantoate 2-reductase [Chloroflexaceae bacterium]
MRITIIGAGALGGVIGWYLSGVAGHEVWLLDGWAEHVDTMRQQGLSCEREGVVATRPVRATTDPAEIGPCDMVLVLVKAHQTPWAAEQIGRTQGSPLPGSSLVVTLQNGVGNREVLAAALPGVAVTQGVTMMGATLLGPGQVRHAGVGSTFFHANGEG